MGEVSAFVGEFGQWNAIHNGLPMMFLSKVPSSEAGDAAFMLFWFWLHDPQGFASLNSSQGGGSSGNPNGTPIGTIGGSQGGGTSDGNSHGVLPFGSASGGSTLGLNDPPVQSNGANNEADAGANQAFGGHSIGSNVSPFDPVPEPASATLLAVGGFGLLMGWRVRSRKSSS
jgi:hypothetical protein